MLKKIVLTLCLLMSAAAFAASTQPVQFTSNQTPISVTQNQTFKIILPSNATTGYAWKWDQNKFDSNLVTLVSHKYIAPQTKLMGAPGYEVWKFKANPGNYSVVQVGHIVMEYQRPWIKTPGTKKTFIVHIH